MTFYTESYTQAYKLRNALKERDIKATVTRKPWNDLYHKITVDPGSHTLTKDYVLNDLCPALNIDNMFTFNLFSFKLLQLTPIYATPLNTQGGC